MLEKLALNKVQYEIKKKLTSTHLLTTFKQYVTSYPAKFHLVDVLIKSNTST